MPLIIPLEPAWDVDGPDNEQLRFLQNAFGKSQPEAGKHALGIRRQQAAAAFSGRIAELGVRECPH
jgi:hypothetical protein